MNSVRAFRLFIFALVLLTSAWPASAEEMVTITKSRLEELERKEAELAKLKGEFSDTKAQNMQLQKQHEVDAAKIAAPPIVQARAAATHVSPPLASLPPLQPGETVDALDLANYYRADAAAADERYGKKTFTMRGQVSGFDKPMLRRDYKIVIKTDDQDLHIVCELYPPEKYSAVFTAKSGTELVGLLAGGTRVTLAKVGDTILVSGRCRGLRDSQIVLSSCQLQPGP